MTAPAPPKSSRVRNGVHEAPITIWLPAEVLAALDARVEQQREHLAASVPGARITRHALISAAVRQLLAPPTAS